MPEQNWPTDREYLLVVTNLMTSLVNELVAKEVLTNDQAMTLVRSAVTKAEGETPDEKIRQAAEVMFGPAARPVD